MSDKIKVFNPQKFDIGVITLDKPMGINIKSGSFALLNEDDIAYVTSISTLFQRGMLRVDETRSSIMESVGIDMDADPNFFDDEEIKQYLSASAKKVEIWLSTITESYILDRIYDVAKDMNLNVSKIRVLQAKMPDKDFISE